MARRRNLSITVGRLLVLGALVVGTAFPAAPATAFKPVKVAFPVEISTRSKI